jgi:outer membrane immunogenic protein
MKKFLMAGVAMLALSGAAFAADLPSNEEPAFTPVAAPAPLFTWTGFYGGLNFGYGFGSFTNDASGLDNADGILGGAQIGYNFQYGSMVGGLEADWQMTDMWDRGGGVTASLDNFGTVRARLGVAADRFLPYLTGGYAFANTSVTAGGTETNLHHGWVVGAGVEYAWTDNITTKFEGLYLAFDEERFGAGGPVAGMDAFVIRTGLNFKF